MFPQAACTLGVAGKSATVPLGDEESKLWKLSNKLNKRISQACLEVCLSLDARNLWYIGAEMGCCD